MKLISLTLENFRQFLGSNQVRFSPEPTKPFTICYAVNGGGKTTILSALDFVFSGGDLKYIDNPGKALNTSYFDSAQEGDTLTFTITLQFEQRGQEFTVRRARQFKKFENEERFAGETLELLDSGGNSITPAQKNLNNVLPPSLSKFFFFPGENLDSFFDPDRLRLLKEDVESIYDLHIYRRLAKLARATSADLARRLRSTNVGEELRNAFEMKERANLAIENCRELLAQVDGEIEKADREIARTERILESNSHARDAVARKKDAERELADANARIQGAERAQVTLRVTSGYGLFTARLADVVARRLAALKEAGQVGGSIGPRQIMELLQNNSTCVCGRHLGEPEIAHLNAKLDSHVHSFGGAPFVDLDRELREGALNVGLVARQFGESFSELESALSQREEAVIAIEEAATVLVGTSESELSSAFDDFVKFTDAKRDAVERRNGLASRLEEAEIRLVEANSTIETCRQNNVTARVPTVQIAYLDLLAEELDREIQNLEKLVINELEEELNELIPSFLSVAQADVRLGSDFAPVITPDLGMAQGQRQATAIAMMIALNRIANRRANSLEEFNLAGPTEFPLVIDSAFGQLGFEYRELVAKQLLKEPSQVVLLVTDSQSEHVVEAIGDEHCGNQWLLQVHDESDGRDYEFKLRGRAVVGKFRNSAPLRTEFVEVNW